MDTLQVDYKYLLGEELGLYWASALLALLQARRLLPLVLGLAFKSLGALNSAQDELVESTAGGLQIPAWRGAGPILGFGPSGPPPGQEAIAPGSGAGLLFPICGLPP